MFVGEVFEMIVIVASIATIIICTLHYLINEKPFEEAEPLEPPKPFIVSEYCDRIEKISLKILEEQEPVEKIVILWWGLDGLRMNEDGSLEWISRKKTEPVKQNVFYQPCQTIQPRPKYDMCQSTQTTIDELHTKISALQVQSAQDSWNAAMMAALQSCVVPPPSY